MAVPSLTDALVDAISRALAASADKLVRVEDIHGISIDELMESLDPDKQCRFGFITPYKTHLVRRRSGVVKDPREITRWRNEPVARRRNAPVVIFGTASGRDESGLKKVPNVIRPGAILEVYKDQLLSYLHATVQSHSPAALCKALFGMAAEGITDLAELDSYFKETLKDATTAVSKPQKNLWKLRLIPDPRAMDEGSPGARLSRNLQTVELLRNQADTVVEEKQLDRLETAAEAGNETAVWAMKFRRSGRKEDLRGLELDGVLQLMAARGSDPLPPARSTVSFFDALDRRLIQKQQLDHIADRWSLDADTFSYESEVAGLSLRMTAKADRKAFAILAAERQVIATERPAGTSREDATLIYDDELLQSAKNADVLKGKRIYEPLAESLIESRRATAPLQNWHADLLELLVVSDAAKETADNYLQAWGNLADEVLKEHEHAAVSALVANLSKLDGHWIRDVEDNRSNAFQSVELLCIHPFVLRPLSEVAQYARTNLGEENLGRRVLWAYDRVLPAYPAIWRGSEVFIHSEGSETPLYSVRAQRSLPPASTATGILDVVRSFVGLHPYTQRHLSVLLIDPPGGGGISRALDDCIRKKLTRDLRVYIAHTDRRDTEFPATTCKIEYLGNVKAAKEWAKNSNVLVHIAFVFRRARDAETGSHTGAAEPSRGLHNSLTATLEPPERTNDAHAGSWIPKVVIQPRDSNDVVRRFMQLARQSYGPERLYRISPMLPEQDALELEALSEIAEWIAVATPSPIGLVPPRSFPEGGLTYLGREDCGPYGLFMYSRDLFSVRKRFEELLTHAPIATSAAQVEAEIQKLALTVPNGILRIGRGDGQVLVQVGLIAASHFARELQR